MGDGKHHDRGELPTVDLARGGGGSDDGDVSQPEVARVASAFDPPGDRFETVGELGRGGMGRVDDAVDRALGRPVAIKHMLSSSDVDLARFEREARITARLEHPGIVPIHDAGRSADGTPYYVMRRVDGRPLESLVTKSLAERLALIPNVLAACDAIAFAHARGIVHRDLKPTNILVGPFGETLVIDWGLAREIAEADAGGSGGSIPPSDGQLTRAGAVAGTPGFMAPEQARGEAVDARADVFALGATLFFVLSGQLPYGSASATQMVDFAGAGRAPDWRVLPTDVPAELRAIAMKAMESEAGERYSDAGALAADLRRFITGNLVGAYEYGFWARIRRFVRRHRAAVAVATVSALVLVLGTALSVRRILAERDDATEARGLAEAGRLEAAKGQREAAAMADRMLVEQARQLALTDPTAAIMMLRRLGPSSTRWREAWVAAQTAKLHGIPFGFTGVPNDITTVQIGEGNLAAVLSVLSGKLSVIDLAKRTRRQVATIEQARVAYWIGPTTLAVLDARQVQLVDITTGAVRPVGVEAITLHGGHSSRVWAQTTDHRVVEIDATGAVHEVMHGIDSVSPSRDLSEATVLRDGRLEALDTRADVELAKLDATRVVAMVEHHVVAAFDSNDLRIWQLVDDKIVERPRRNRTNRVQLAIANDTVFAVGPEGILMVRGDGYEIGEEPIQVAGITGRTQQGLVAAGRDGSIHIYDGSWFALGSRGLDFRRVDASPDGRYAIACASSGDIMAWDLEGVKPRRFTIDTGERLSTLTRGYLWVVLIPNELARYALAAPAREPIFANMGLELADVDRDERFAMGFSGVDHGVMLWERDSIGLSHVSDVWLPSMSDRVGMVNHDGAVSTWKPGSGPPEPRGTFGGHVLDFTTSRRYALANTDDELLRLDYATRSVERTRNPSVKRFAIEDDGRAWIISGLKLWRWDLHGTPELVETPDPVDSVTVRGDAALMHASRSMIEFVGGRPHIMPVTAIGFSWEDDSPTFAVVLPQNEVRVIDRATGLGVVVPDRCVDRNIVMGDHAVAFVDRIAQYEPTRARPVVAIWDLDVPDDPAALRAWLGTVTNARAIPDSDAFAWP